MNKENKRIIIISTIVLVIALILSVVGVSYAFFNLQINGEDTTTKIELSTGEAGGITLSGKVENFHITVDAKDMAYKNLGEYYATNEVEKNYADSKEDGIKELGRIDISGTLSETNSCSATIKLEFTSSIIDKIQSGDFTLGIIYGEEEQEIDLKNTPSEGTVIEFELDGKTSPTYIQAYLKLNNANRDQSYLASQEINVSVKVDSFMCEGYDAKPVLEMLTSTTDEEYLKPAFEGDELTRYIGTYEEITNNYICFGALEKTCLNNPEQYMYRIIGITNDNVNKELGLENGMLKLIKATPSNTGQAWGTSSSDSCDWDNANVQKDIQTFYTESTKYAKIKPYIVEINWWKGDNIGSSSNPPTSETQTPTITKYRVGLMYASDYYNSWTSYSSSGNTDSWLNICHGLSSGSPECKKRAEWTMSRYGYYSDWDAYTAWTVYSSGFLGVNGVGGSFEVRPVFYLTPDITLSGEGTEDNPFIIHA